MIDDEKVTESSRHDLFDKATIRELGHALQDSDGDVRKNSLDFFLAAIAHGIPFHFHSRIILKYV